MVRARTLLGSCVVLLGACARLADLDTSGGGRNGPGADGGADESPQNLAGDVQITPASKELDFSAVACGDRSPTSTITLLNTTGSNIAWTATPPADSPFFVDGPTSGTIAAHGTAAIAVGVAPTLSGDLVGSIAISAGQSFFQVVAHARGQGADLAYLSGVADFGQVRVNNSSQIPIQLKNSGTGPAVVTSFTSTDPTFVVSWAGTGPLVIAPGATADATAIFNAPSATASATATLQPVVSSGLCSAPPSLTAKAASVITDVGVTVADFGAQSCNTTPTSTQTVTISNYLRSTPLALTDFAISGTAFTLGTPPTQAPVASDDQHPGTATITVSAAPIGQAITTYAETLSFKANGAPQSTPVRMTVQGANLVITPSRLEFSASTSSLFGDTESFTVQNTGNASIRVSYDFVRTVGAAAWYKDDSTDDIAAGQTAKITMTFKPSDTGDHEATETPHRVSGAQNCTPMPVGTAHGVGR